MLGRDDVRRELPDRSREWRFPPVHGDFNCEVYREALRVSCPEDDPGGPESDRVNLQGVTVKPDCYGFGVGLLYKGEFQRVPAGISEPVPEFHRQNVPDFLRERKSRVATPHPHDGRPIRRRDRTGRRRRHVPCPARDGTQESERGHAYPRFHLSAHSL